MNGIAAYGDRRYALQEIADVTGAAYRTVAAYAQKAGWTENGKQTLLDERQATVIIEAMKQGANNQHDLASRSQGVETALTPTLKLEMLYRQIDEIKTAEIKRLKDENQALQIRMNEAEQWQTVKRYVREHGYSHAISEMRLIGRELSRMSRESGHEVRKAADANYGEVNAYHVDMLREYFEGSL